MYIEIRTYLITQDPGQKPRQKKKNHIRQRILRLKVPLIFRVELFSVNV